MIMSYCDLWNKRLNFHEELAFPVGLQPFLGFVVYYWKIDLLQKGGAAESPHDGLEK